MCPLWFYSSLLVAYFCHFLVVFSDQKYRCWESWPYHLLIYVIVGKARHFSKPQFFFKMGGIYFLIQTGLHIWQYTIIPLEYE